VGFVSLPRSRACTGAGSSPSPFAATILQLQRTIGNASVTTLLTGGTPVVQRQIGWPKPVGTKNDAEHTVDGVDRYPIYGLSHGNQEEETDPKSSSSWMDGHTKEKADKRAIVLIPSGLDTSSKPDVIFELHGHYIGWREGKDNDESAGSVKGTTRDQSKEAIVQSLPNKTIAVLPQGTANSGFGSIDPPTYIEEALGMIPEWKGKPTGRLLFGAHSGGGGALNPDLGPKMLGPPGKDKKPTPLKPGEIPPGWEVGREKRQAARKAKLPGGLREIALFDAINGPNELGSVKAWLWDSVTSDIEALKTKDAAGQTKYLESVVIFRGYYEGDYIKNYEDLAALRDSLLKDDQRPKEISTRVWGDLGDHYLITKVTAGHHDMVKQNLPEALKAMNLKGSP